MTEHAKDPDRPTPSEENVETHVETTKRAASGAFDLERACCSLGLSPQAASRLVPVMRRYAAELRDANPRFGLVSRDDVVDEERLFSRHLLDSIAPWHIIDELMASSGRHRLYDLGSGAGLPGIPLSYALSAASADDTTPGRTFRGPSETVLVERRGKRVAFLLGVLPMLAATWRASASSVSASNVTAPRHRVLEVDADHLARHESELLADAVVVFRAYQQTTEEFVARLRRTFGPGAPICALKGTQQHMDAERRIIDDSPHGQLIRADSLAVPGTDAQRGVLIWQTV